MSRIKFFKGTEVQLDEMQREIDSWLEETGARVTQMQSIIAPQTPSGEESHGLTKSAFAPSDVLVTFLYDLDG